MAIDYTGITSIDTGAPDIKYTGDEGPRSPEENREVALAILGDEAGEVASQLWNGMSPPEKSEWRSIEGFIQSEDFKIILMQLKSNQQEDRGGIQMASAADPMLQEQYEQYVFEMQEQGLEPMSLEQFRQEAVAGMATGGRVGYASGQLVKPGPGRPGYNGDDIYSAPSKSKSYDRGYVGGPQDWGQQEKAEKVSTGQASWSPGEAKSNPYSAKNLGVSQKDHKQELQKLSAASPSHGGIGTNWSDTQTYKENFNVPGDDDPEVIEKIKKKQIEDTEAARVQRYYDTKASKKVKARLLKLLKTQFKDHPDYKDEDWDELSWDQILDFRSALDPTDEKWDERYSKYGTAPGAWTGIGPWFSKFMAAPDLTQSEFDLLINKAMGKVPTKDETGQYIKPVYDPKTKTYTSGFETWKATDPKEADWLEKMKFDNPMQYANYTGTNYNPTTGEFTKKKEEGYGGVPDAVPYGNIPEWQQQGFNSYADWLAAQGTGITGTTGTSSIATGPITGQLGGIDQGHLDILKNIYGGTLPAQFAADGGRIGYAGGGIADLRQGYFLGKIVKAVTKPFKSASKSLKKLTKSPIGKIALMYGLGSIPFGTSNASLLSRMGSMFGGAKISPGTLGGKTPGLGGWLSRVMGSIKTDPFPWIAGASALGGLYTAMGDDDEDELYKKWLADKAAADAYWIPRFDESNFRRIASAQGGRIGYADAGDVDPIRTAILEQIKNGTLTFEDLIKYEETGEMPGEQSLKPTMQDFGIIRDTLMSGEQSLKPIMKDLGITKEARAKGGRIGYAGGGDMAHRLSELIKKSNAGTITSEEENEMEQILIMLDYGPGEKDGGRIGYAGGGNGKDDSMVGISMSIEERWERIKKMLQQLEDIRSGKTTDPKYDPEDKAQGGRIGYAGGGYNDEEEEDHRMAALRAMYGTRRNAQEGGLMDLGGMEKDYRNEGGFVPIGGQERADDVPARLSRNEFVFTADAVRAAGGGDIDRGAEVMENVMENLEKGGKVSDESQGLEGARDMFATAQRLEGVL
jgi:hypothetical protein